MSKPPANRDSKRTPDSEPLDLNQIDEKRTHDLEKGRGFLGKLALFSFADMKAFRGLLRFVKPYRGLLVASVGIALIGALFLGVQFLILDEGLQGLLGGSQDEIAECPECNKELIIKPVETESKSPTEMIKGFGKKKEDEPKEKYTLVKRDREAEHLAHLEREKSIGSRKHSLKLMAFALIFLVAFEGICKYTQSVMMGSASRRVIMDLRLALFDHLMGMSLRFFQRNHSASLVSRITHDLTIMGGFLTDAMVRIVRESFSFIVLLFMIMYQQGAFILVVAGIIAVAFIPVQLLGRRLRKSNKAGQRGMEAIYRVLTEAFTGQRVVKAFGAEQREYQRFHDVNRAHYKMIMRVRRLRSAAEPMVQIVGALGIGALIIAGGNRVLAGDLRASTFFVMIFALGRAMASLRIIAKQVTGFQLAMGAADRVQTLLATTTEVVEKPEAPELGKFEKEIRFAKVDFRHVKKVPTLESVSFTVAKGEKLALVGPSGAGKSTVVDLLPRFFDVDKGAISIDGVNIRDVSLKSLRAQIGIVAQDTVLFEGTIAENILYGRPDATREEVEAAAGAANAHGFITKAPDGYDTEIGERGFKLSGGERQRLSIARALLRNPPILILDEATSSLDSESEAVVQNALDNLMKDRTVLVIAHRLATVRDADRILVIEAGRVAEVGKHQELLDKRGTYWRLSNLQFNPNREPASEISEDSAPKAPQPEPADSRPAETS